MLAKVGTIERRENLQEHDKVEALNNGACCAEEWTGEKKYVARIEPRNRADREG